MKRSKPPIDEAAIGPKEFLAAQYQSHRYFLKPLMQF